MVQCGRQDVKYDQDKKINKERKSCLFHNDRYDASFHVESSSKTC